MHFELTFFFDWHVIEAFPSSFRQIQNVLTNESSLLSQSKMRVSEIFGFVSHRALPEALALFVAAIAVVTRIKS